MADEENNTESTPVGEPKPAEMSGSVTKKAAPKKKAPAKKKAAPKKKAPAKKAAAKKSETKAAAPAAAAVATAASTTANAAPRRTYTPPPKKIWWQALIFIAIVVYGYGLISDAAKAPGVEGAGNAEQAAAPEMAPQMMPPMMPMPPMNGMGNGMGFGNGQPMPPQADGQPGAMSASQAPRQPAPNTQAMPQQPYSGYPQQGYYPPQGYPQGPGFYGPGGWYGPGNVPMPYPPMPRY